MTATIPAAAAVPVALQPALDRLTDLKAKAEEIERQRIKAEYDLLADVRAELEAGQLDADAIATFYVIARGATTSTFHERWNEVLPVRMNGLGTRHAHRVRLARLYSPNGPGDNCWTGTVPIGPEDPRPPRGACVVYVLFDATNEPIYVGSTSSFQTRLADHVRDGKPAARWMAYRCDTREQAYEMEERLLREAKLPLNQKASR